MSRSLNRFSIADIHADIRRRQRSAATLERRHARLSTKLRTLEAQIRALGGDANGAARRGFRPRNDKTLVDSLASVLKGKTLSVTDAAAAVQKAGYRTNSNNFRTQVNIALIKGGIFKRVGRGMYSAK